MTQIEGVLIIACVFNLDYASDGGRDYYDSSVLFKLDLIWRA